MGSKNNVAFSKGKEKEKKITFFKQERDILQGKRKRQKYLLELFKLLLFHPRQLQ